MKPALVLVLLLLAGCHWMDVTEARARDLAHTEFRKTCATVGVDPAIYKEGVPANIRGKDVVFSFIWYPRDRGKVITVTVEKSGWTEAGMGPDYEAGKILYK